MKLTDDVTTTKKSNGINSKTFIVLHHTAGGSYLGNLDRLSKNKVQASVHYVVGYKGEVGRIGNESNILWHAGNKITNDELKSFVNLNRHSIGIEIVSDTKGKGFTDLQRKSVEKLVKYLMEEFTIAKENIIRHKDITTAKVDVDDTFWNNSFKTYRDYINSTFGEKEEIIEEKGKYDDITGYEIFNDLSEDRDTKKLIEIGLYRFIQELKEKTLKIRK